VRVVPPPAAQPAPTQKEHAAAGGVKEAPEELWIE